MFLNKDKRNKNQSLNLHLSQKHQLLPSTPRVLFQLNKRRNKCKSKRLKTPPRKKMLKSQSPRIKKKKILKVLPKLKLKQCLMLKKGNKLLLKNNKTFKNLSKSKSSIETSISTRASLTKSDKNQKKKSIKLTTIVEKRQS